MKFVTKTLVASALFAGFVGSSQAADADGAVNGSATALLLGAGAEYSLTKNVAVRAEYEYIGSSNLKSNLMTVGLRYSF